MRVEDAQSAFNANLDCFSCALDLGSCQLIAPATRTGGKCPTPHALLERS